MNVDTIYLLSKIDLQRKMARMINLLDYTGIVELMQSSPKST